MQLSILGLLISVSCPALLTAQTVAQPDIGYIFPPAGRAGEIIEVVLGTYDVTPDSQFFVLDHSDRIRLEIVGAAGPLLRRQPPYLSGPKSYNQLPLPREIPAKLHLPAELPEGIVRWQIANANGASKIGTFIVTRRNEIVEQKTRSPAQPLDPLPVAVSGRLVLNEEVDRYAVRVQKAGPITCDLLARRLGSPMHGVIEVRDETGDLVADVADTGGQDAQLTFFAEADRRYTISVRDVDFRGHRSYVYRLAVRRGPRVLATIPAVGRRCESCQMEFIGVAIATGQIKVESVTRTVEISVAADATAFDYRLETPFGMAAPFPILLSDSPQTVRRGPDTIELDVPLGVTGTFDDATDKHRYQFRAAQGEQWSISAAAQQIGSPLDLALSVIGPDHKTLSHSDDLPGTTDAGAVFTAEVDGTYDVVVNNLSGQRTSRAAVYHLAIERPRADFTIELSQQRISVPIGGQAELQLHVIRHGRFDAPINLQVDGLPSGISVPAELTVPKDKSKFSIPLKSAEDGSSFASVIQVIGTAQVGDDSIARVGLARDDGNAANRVRERTQIASILVASTMKPVCEVRPEESDERTVHRGSTHMNSVLFNRLNGFEDPLLVVMAARQPEKFRQGASGPDTILPARASQFYYPLFMPEGLETSDAYRISLNAVAEVTDRQGNRRHLVTTFPGDTTFGITIEGALLRLSHEIRELTVESGRTFKLPVRIARSPKLAGTAHLELKISPELAGRVNAEPIIVGSEVKNATLVVTMTNGNPIEGKYMLTIRATVLERSDLLPKMVDLDCSPLDKDLLFHMRQGFLPVMSETNVPVQFVFPKE